MELIEKLAALPYRSSTPISDPDIDIPDKVFYREARDLIEENTQARELGDLRKYRG